MTYLAQVMDDLAIEPARIAQAAGVSVETARRWRNGTRPRPRAALSVARQFPKPVGVKLLSEWGYSAKPLDYTDDTEAPDTLALILKEVRAIRMILQQPEPIPWPPEGETQ
jgi:hypothetical protein